MNKPLRITLIATAALSLATLVNFAPMASLRLPGMREYTFSGMTVIAMPFDRPEAERIAARIAKQSASVSEALGTADTDSIGVIIYPDRKDLHRKTIGLAGALLPNWFIGDNTRSYVLITSPAAPGPSHDRGSIERAAVHEYIHVLTDRRNKQLGYWLKEGIALYLAGQIPSPSSVRSYADLSWEEFSRPNALQFAELGGYSLAYTFIEYLREHYGWDAVVGLTAPDATFDAVLGCGERELYDRWIAAVREL